MYIMCIYINVCDYKLNIIIISTWPIQSNPSFVKSGFGRISRSSETPISKKIRSAKFKLAKLVWKQSSITPWKMNILNLKITCL